MLTQQKNSGTWGCPRVLVVDDEAAVLRAVPRVLRSAAPDWRVHVAATGSAALHVLESDPIDVLVTDLGMPEMDGVELMAIVADQFPEVTRIAHSADRVALESDRVRRYASFRLAKPVSPTEFTDTLDAALAQRRLAVAR